MTSHINSLGNSLVNSPGDSLGTPAVGIGSAVKSATDKPAGGSACGSTAAATTDTVSLTGDAVRLQQLQQAATAAPEINGGRVASIKNAIADGSYRVDSQAVAAKMTRMDWDLGTA